MYISSLLKKHGHQCRLLILSEETNYLHKLIDFDPDLIAFSTMTGLHKWVLRIAKEIKKKVDKPIILGGPHPTFFPEIIHQPPVDIVCIGEGEFAVLKLVDKMDRREDIYHIPNLWLKKDGQIIKNDLIPLVEDLDDLPFPDRTLYDGCKILRAVPAMKFLTGRGCPYRCAFCFNRTYNELYRGLGRIVRKRGIDNLIEEIKEVKQKYRLKLVRFPDDTFSGNRHWLLEFLAKYKKEIGLPFTALAHANELDETVVKMMKSTGCLNIYFGVETGNERLRNRILNKNLSNKQILEAARILKKHKLKFGTYNMFALPEETLDMAFETIELNRKIKPDYTINNIFQPYPKTEIAEYAVRQGLLDPHVEYLDTMNEGSILKLEDTDRLVNLSRFATLIIRFPFLIPLIKVLIKLPSNRFYKFIFDLSSAPAMRSNLNLSLIHLVRWGIQLRKMT
jgi:radical SAM superfamily enzyme YgiQ (UPF0313 family)